MELSEHDEHIEEIVGRNHEFGLSFESPFYENSEFIGGLITPHESNFECPNFTSQEEDQFSYSYLDSFNLPLQLQHEYNNIISADLNGFMNNVKVEEGVGEKKKKIKKVEGQPSKNLMAERRRRKRLNDRLSMLRSIVPKISKMDRTSILGDTIDYMKELLEKIDALRLRDDEVKEEIKDIKVKELKPNEAVVRKPPKFDVERRSGDTRIEICCAAKPGLLLSTVNTLEALGLDVQQCVISSFTDFSFQASCSEATEHRTFLSAEDVKQSLFKTAGYGGTCL